MAKDHKPLLLRGARQVGKSCAIRHLGESFAYFVEINFEKQKQYKILFEKDLNVNRIVSEIEAMSGIPLIGGKTLLFLDEIQDCVPAIMSLRFFKEDLPQLHVIAAGSLLEFALEGLPSYGVGRIHSMYMYPMTFDEFLMANGLTSLIKLRKAAGPSKPLNAALHDKLVEQIRVYLLVGGMPEVVSEWVNSHDYLACQTIQDDILVGYQDDFAKYSKRVDPELLRLCFSGVALQTMRKFIYARVGDGYRVEVVKRAISLLIQAGIVVPCVRSKCNGFPLGSEKDTDYMKLMIHDTGLMLRLQDMSLGNYREISTSVLTSTAAELVNKGAIVESMVGLEMRRYQADAFQHELFYWTREERNSVAEVDYVEIVKGQIMPVEVKASTRGGMKSLWLMMREKHLTEAIRCSMENYSEYNYTDSKDDDTVRHVSVWPVYSISDMVEQE